MKIKSLLIGSAAAMVLSTGARAADAVVYAEPEPMEYVRICDVYGSGFFYIPGTETCLRIGGYFRVQVNLGELNNNFIDGYNSYARFTPTFDVRSQTEWGTLRGYAEVELTWASNGSGTATNLAHAFIDIGDENFLRIGRSWAWTSLWTGPGFNVNDGFYNRQGVNQITYFFNATRNGGNVSGGAGFSGFVSVVDSNVDDTWSTDVEAGLGYNWGSGSFRLAAAYMDTPYAGATEAAWAVRAGVSQKFGSVTANLSALYNDGPKAGGLVQANRYRLGGGSTFSVLGGLSVAFSPKAAAVLTAQWWNEESNNNIGANWYFAAGVDLKPITGFRIRPEINYIDYHNGGGDSWGGVIRLQRDF